MLIDAPLRNLTLIVCINNLPIYSCLLAYWKYFVPLEPVYIGGKY